MTYWYEMPDDPKDTWHWMGVAISLAQTIGMHRDPAKSSLTLKRQRQWKRIWWSCIIRDRMIALGMRRPTRIKAEECDVPMLMVDDFELQSLSDHIKWIPLDCTPARSVETQRSLALMCIEIAKLCLCISHILAAQYSVPDQHIGDEVNPSTRATVLLPKALDREAVEFKQCQEELRTWLDGLPLQAQMESCVAQGPDRSHPSLTLNATLLHMVYYTAVSALYRPQSIQDTSGNEPVGTSKDEPSNACLEIVRHAASEITRAAKILLDADLVRFLPTAGVTVLLPAIIGHMVYINATDAATRTRALQGFCQCVQTLSRLRDLYASADYTLAMLEVAVRRANIQIPRASPLDHLQQRERAFSTDDLLEAGVQQQLVKPLTKVRTLTPPPDAAAAAPGAGRRRSAQQDEAMHAHALALAQQQLQQQEEQQQQLQRQEQQQQQQQQQQHHHHQQQTDFDVAKRLETFLASTPPASDHHHSAVDTLHMAQALIPHDLDHEFESLINVDDLADTFTFDDGGLAAMQGESSGFRFEMDMFNVAKDDEQMGG